MTMIYKTLEEVDFQDIHQSFVTAFSDYIVDMLMPETALREMNELRGVDLSLSVGAFSEGNLVGFTLNGFDHWNGRRTGYDSGTGVIPSMRGLGISKELMLQSFAVLEQRGAEHYVLEVIRENDKAFQLYQNLGFEVTRQLECLTLKHQEARRPVKSRFPVDEVPVDRRHLLEGLDGFVPSWQNSWNTLRRGPDRYHVIAVWEASECLGFGAIMVGRGNIAQLWVRPEMRRLGLGTQLLQELMRRSPGQKNYNWVNIDARSEDTLAFLRAMGFNHQLSQFEMERRLG